MAIDYKNLLSNYPLPELQEKKASLEKTLESAHTDQSIDISKLAADLNDTSEILGLYLEMHKLVDAHKQASEMENEAAESELREMAYEERNELEAKIEEHKSKTKKVLVEKKLADPDDMKSVIFEIRAGAGGDEAANFVADLYRMYQAFANTQGWKVSPIYTNSTESGGYKEVIAKIEGKNAYKNLKYESGVHRVQRIPATESGGRIHTSTASVAIMPEAKDVKIDIKDEDLRIDTMRASGAGGQHVNKTSSAIRITHLPTGIVVSCQESRLQQENRKLAMQLLQTRLYDKMRDDEMKKRSDMRSAQIGTAMRAEKIRTYNFPQSRITDHRVKISWHNLEEILNGEISQIVHDVNEAFIEMQIKDLDL